VAQIEKLLAKPAPWPLKPPRGNQRAIRHWLTRGIADDEPGPPRSPCPVNAEALNVKDVTAKARRLLP